ncbi:Putative acetyltransferase SACOL2570 [Alistipes sp. cv1]|jgi:acetyltransferase-like isoleucine patch superfamily enzyme|nr:hypothetical protein [uncultured Alistipes sp.]VDR34853.1 Putative acetyltransferase SACOL2570 [Faecalibacterium prausnitzii]
MDGVVIHAPLHSNYGDSRVKFGNLFINYNCTFQPGGGVEIGDDVFIGSDVRIYTTNHPLDPTRFSQIVSAVCVMNLPIRLTSTAARSSSTT